MDDAIWGRTDPSDMSIDTANSAEIMTCSHIMEEYAFNFCRSDPHELLNMAAHVPHKDDLLWYFEPDFLDSYQDWNKSLNVVDTINSGENITGAHSANQEHQNYYNGQIQQYVACKYNSGLEQVTSKLVPNIIIEEEEDWIYQ